MKKPVKPRGPRNLKRHGFTNALWRLEERSRAEREKKSAHKAKVRPVRDR